MENQPEAPAAAPAAESVATPNINPTPAAAPAQAPNMYGFTSEQLADMRKFYDNNGGYEKVKSRISNPAPAQPQPNLNATQALQNQQEQMKAPVQPTTTAPKGSITAREFLAQQYFSALSREKKYEPIAREVETGAVLKDMAAFNIRPINDDGSINDTMVRRYLDLKAQTVTAKQTSATPDAGAAPTVDYAPYNENGMDMKQAMAILQQDSALRSRGMGGHPNAAQAEEFMKKTLNPQK
jgi:hypothetical protein